MVKDKQNKIKYYFILGNNPALSLAEIVILLGVKEEDTVLGKDFLIVDLEKSANANELMKILGGTIKVGIITSQKFNFQAGDLIDNLVFSKDKKFYFGFSAYGDFNNKFNNQLRQLGMETKKELKQKGVSSRWVVSREKQLSSVVVKKNKLVSDQGIEWCILKNQNKIYLGKTLAAQEFEEYGRRDYQRPARDARSGMIPPKLARMMINIARVRLGWVLKPSLTGCDLTLLDPFCGSGTILQEAAMLGFKKIIGSDLSGKATGDTKRNLQWLEKSLNLKFNLTIHNSDVKQLGNLFKGGSIDLIVTEPYLGPPLRGNETQKTIDKIIYELSELYLAAFKEFRKILKKDGRVCMVWPVFISHQKKDKNFLPILDEVKKMDFKLVDLISNKYKKNLAVNLSERGTIIYGRKRQLVWREIMVFK